MDLTCAFSLRDHAQIRAELVSRAQTFNVIMHRLGEVPLDLRELRS
jgi:hypothetical protein